MAQSAAATAEVQLGRRRGGIRWRRWLGLSFPSLIALTLVVTGLLADLLETHDPDFIDLAVRLQPPVFDGGPGPTRWARTSWAATSTAACCTGRACR